MKTDIIETLKKYLKNIIKFYKEKIIKKLTIIIKTTQFKTNFIQKFKEKIFDF